ncbi:MAG: hypothetical protein HY526_04050 [Betaproteobacteria bacterium]|nr:hypothetical protein [Betaproteobacteria bacterium]
MLRRTHELAALASLTCLVHVGGAQASVLSEGSEVGTGLAARAAPEFTRFIRSTSRARSVILAGKPSPESARPARPSVGAKPSSGAAVRAGRPVVTVTAAGAGQAGYVHYFLLRLPDETLEIQVGIELPDQRIAWSFPDLGVVVSPFIDAGVVAAGRKDYEVWHLYGIRPFPDDAAMAVLRNQLADRIRPWVAAKTPYCENDGPRSECMSCLGFVLRALFPGRGGAYPDLPRDFWRAGTASKYTTRDLLLYLTGMLDLPTRAARLTRIAGLTLPDELREDLEALVYSMGAAESAASSNAGPPRDPAQSRSGTRPSKVSTRPPQRRPL